MGKLKAVLCLLLIYQAASAQTDFPKTFQMDRMETDDLQLLYFDPPQTYLVPHVTLSFYNSLKFQREVLGWEPYDKTTVLLKDFSDYGNAAARSAPNNAMIVDVAPLSRTFETFSASERIFMLMNHELTHVATMDASSRKDRGWRKFFGGKPTVDEKHPETILYSYLVTPRVSVPRWYLEGSAVFMETWMSGGLGRAQGPYDEMVFRSMVRDGAHFYSPLGLVAEGTRVDFQVGVNAYLYGTRFFSYLGWAYSPEMVVKWLQRGEDSKRYYAKQFKHVFGKKLDEAWQDWIAWERQFQTENLAAIEEFPITLSRPLVDRALGSISRSFVDLEKNELMGAFRYPGTVAHIGRMSLADGSIEHLADIKGPMLYRVTALAKDRQSNTYFYTADNHAFRDLMKLDADTGKTEMLIKDARIGELVVNPADRSIWGIRHLNGYATLVRIPPPYTSWNQVHTWPYGDVLYDMDISPDGTLLSTSMGTIGGTQLLRIFSIENLLAGDTEHVAELDFFGTAVPEGFVFSPDGRFLYGSSYYTGVSNIWRYEVANGELEAVSNTATGFFRPIPLEDGSLIVFEYTGQGFVPGIIDPMPLEDASAVRFLGAELVKKHPQIKEWEVVSTLGELAFEDIERTDNKYRPGRELELQSAYPVVEGFKDSTAFGWHFNIEDTMAFRHLGITASYSPDSDLPSDERTHINIDYRTINWRLGYKFNGADFFDLFGPTKRSRKGHAFTLGYEKPLIYDAPRRLDFTAGLSYYNDLDTLPDFQNIGTVFDELLTGELELSYKYARSSLGHVDDEKGYSWNLVAFADRVNGNTVPKWRADFDFGLALPIPHSSVWLRSSSGGADGDRADPLANFYFGGFGNNDVDNGNVKRYREYYSFPGFNINELSGQKYVRSVFEWNLPPIRFRNVGKPGFYLAYARPAVFYGVLVTDPGNSVFERTVYTLGAQLDFQFTFAHRLDMTISVGYAEGYEDGNKLGDEWMVSLKLLAFDVL